MHCLYLSWGPVFELFDEAAKEPAPSWGIRLHQLTPGVPMCPAQHKCSLSGKAGADRASVRVSGVLSNRRLSQKTL